MAKINLDDLKLELDIVLVDKVRELLARLRKANDEAETWKEKAAEWRDANHRLMARIEELESAPEVRCTFHGFTVPCPACRMAEIDAGIGDDDVHN